MQDLASGVIWIVEIGWVLTYPQNARSLTAKEIESHTVCNEQQRNCLELELIPNQGKPYQGACQGYHCILEWHVIIFQTSKK